MNWIRRWESYWYFVKQLYGDKRIPEKIKDMSVANFTFMRQRGPGHKIQEHIKANTINNYNFKDKFKNVTPEEVHRINQIIREEVENKKE